MKHRRIYCAFKIPDGVRKSLTLKLATYDSVSLKFHTEIEFGLLILDSKMNVYSLSLKR